MLLRLMVIIGWVLTLPGLAYAGAATAAAAVEIPATPAAFSGDPYIGLADDGLTAIAILVGDTEARAYFCDGQTISSWLAGSRRGGELTLRSEDGIEVIAVLSDGQITGAIRYADTTSLSFRAGPATGVAGLYDATIAGDGRVTGRSTEGLRLVGAVIPGFDEGSRVFAGIIERPEGGAVPVGAPVIGEGGPGELRLIVQADGRLVGSSRTGNKQWLPSNF